jgi:hypothetical protein
MQQVTCDSNYFNLFSCISNAGEHLPFLTALHLPDIIVSLLPLPPIQKLNGFLSIHGVSEVRRQMDF